MVATSFTEAVGSHIDADRSLINTSIPAKVLNYNASTQNCVVKPLVSSLLRDGRQVPFPTLEDVPVMFPSTENSMLTFPISVNDTVLLVFSQRSLDNWLNTKDTNIVNPDDFRKHDFSDAIAIPGLFSFPRAINDPLKHTLVHDTDDFVMAHNVGTAKENEIRLKKDGTIRISAGSGTKLTMNLDGTITLDAPTSLTVTSPITTWIGDINQQGTFTSDTDVVAAGVSLIGHTHAQANDSNGNTQAETEVPT